jgi:hypothetical protein
MTYTYVTSWTLFLLVRVTENNVSSQYQNLVTYWNDAVRGDIWWFCQTRLLRARQLYNRVGTVPTSGMCACARVVNYSLIHFAIFRRLSKWIDCRKLTVMLVFGNPSNVHIHRGCQHLMCHCLCKISPKLGQQLLAPPFCDTSFWNSRLSDAEQAPGGQSGKCIKTAQGIVFQNERRLSNNPSY